MEKLSQIRLRGVEPEDAERLFAVEREGFEDYYGDLVAPLTLEMLRGYALTYDADPFSAGSLRLIAEAEGDVVGVVDLYDISALHQHAEVGIYVCKGHRGNGVGRKILQTVERYCFEKLSLLNLLSRTYSGNVAACRLFESAGYELTGVLRRWQKKGNEMLDINVYQRQMEFC